MRKSYTVNLSTTKPSIALDTDWIKPKLSFVLIALNMHMRWLITITCVTEETIWANGQQSRHSTNPIFQSIVSSLKHIESRITCHLTINGL
jgi:hypothetical protein